LTYEGIPCNRWHELIKTFRGYSTLHPAFHYDGRSLFPRQVFFPMAGEKEGWYRLARNLKAEIDEEPIESYRGTVSLPFTVGAHRRIAVKIVDDRGIESLKIVDLA
jgi:adenine-specific DNA-methyltransferase